METKKIVTIALVIIIGGVVIWQAVDLFSGPGEVEAVAQTKTIPNPDIPKPASLMASDTSKTAPMTEQEIKMMQAQKINDQKYLDQINQLKFLQIELSIAGANKEITKAREDTIASQVKMNEMLKSAQPKTASYTDSLTGLPGAAPADTNAAPPTSSSPGTTASSTTEDYTVVSVTNLQGRWMAVVGLNGKLYNVAVGDTVGSDGATVISIDKSGVTLEKKDKKTKVNMNSVI